MSTTKAQMFWSATGQPDHWVCAMPSEAATLHFWYDDSLPPRKLSYSLAGFQKRMERPRRQRSGDVSIYGSAEAFSPTRPPMSVNDEKVSSSSSLRTAFDSGDSGAWLLDAFGRTTQPAGDIFTSVPSSTTSGLDNGLELTEDFQPDAEPSVWSPLEWLWESIADQAGTAVRDQSKILGGNTSQIGGRLGASPIQLLTASQWLNTIHPMIWAHDAPPTGISSSQHLRRTTKQCLCNVSDMFNTVRDLLRPRSVSEGAIGEALGDVLDIALTATQLVSSTFESSFVCSACQQDASTTMTGVTIASVVLQIHDKSIKRLQLAQMDLWKVSTSGLTQIPSPCFPQTALSARASAMYNPGSRMTLMITLAAMQLELEVLIDALRFISGDGAGVRDLSVPHWRDNEGEWWSLSSLTPQPQCALRTSRADHSAVQPFWCRE